MLALRAWLALLRANAALGKGPSQVCTENPFVWDAMQARMGHSVPYHTNIELNTAITEAVHFLGTTGFDDFRKAVMSSPDRLELAALSKGNQFED